MIRLATLFALLLVMLSGALAPVQTAFAVCKDEVATTTTSSQEASDPCQNSDQSQPCDCRDCDACHFSAPVALIMRPQLSAIVGPSGKATPFPIVSYLSPLRSLAIEPPIARL